MGCKSGKQLETCSSELISHSAVSQLIMVSPTVTQMQTDGGYRVRARTVRKLGLRLP